jgi:U4/U6.U5 tri-snRNP-associated protein 2
LDLPKAPLFKNSGEKVDIPQVSIYQLLNKYNGTTFTEDPVKGIKTRYSFLKLPKNLVLFFKRFEKNFFFVEKNNTIVNFPLKNLSLEEYCREDTKNKLLKYSLMSNVIHDGKPNQGTFRVQVKNKASQNWFDIQDLNVIKIMPQSVVFSESYIHFYECDEEMDQDSMKK